MCLHNSIHLTGNLCKRQIQIKHLNTYPTTMHLIYIVRLDFFFRLRVKKHPWNCILFFSKLIAAVFYIGKNLIQDVLIIPEAISAVTVIIHLVFTSISWLFQFSPNKTSSLKCANCGANSFSAFLPAVCTIFFTLITCPYFNFAPSLKAFPTRSPSL